MSDPFYIGYQDRAPRPLVRFMVGVVSVLLLIAVTVGLLWSGTQPEPAEGTYEFGTVTSWEGTVVEASWPMLYGDDGTTRMLVGPTKSLPDGIGAWIGRRVRLDATRVYRDGVDMLEVLDGTIVETEGQVPVWALPFPSDEPRTFTGEIVDSKCWLGVMNPGEHTVHRACARLCIRGGIPAMLVYLEADGSTHHALVSVPGNIPFPDRLLSYVARPVRMRGVLQPIPGATFHRLIMDESTLMTLD